jgi:hypothetical protein
LVSSSLTPAASAAWLSEGHRLVAESRQHLGDRREYRHFIVDEQYTLAMTSRRHGRSGYGQRGLR